MVSSCWPDFRGTFHWDFQVLWVPVSFPSFSFYSLLNSVFSLDYLPPSICRFNLVLSPWFSKFSIIFFCVPLFIHSEMFAGGGGLFWTKCYARYWGKIKTRHGLFVILVRDVKMFTSHCAMSSDFHDLTVQNWSWCYCVLILDEQPQEVLSELQVKHIQWTREDKD